MRVSEFFRLGRTQPTLDFVDVDITGDTPVFLDPRALRLFPSPWAAACVAGIQNFFLTVLEAIKRDEDERAKGLLRELREPNETHLGLSKGIARGRALGPYLASRVWDSLRRSQAIESGLLENLEDTILLIEGIDADIVSDIATCIVRPQLLEYTEQVAAQLGMPLEDEVAVVALWDPVDRAWYSDMRPMLVTTSGPLLLIPKAVVRRKLDYDAEDYYRHYILEHLRAIEISAGSELVQLLKNGNPRVTSKDLEAKYGRGKATILRESLLNPSLLGSYRRDRKKRPKPPMDHYALAASEGTELPDWEELLGAVRQIEVGKAGASDYVVAIEKLLTALFYPSLTSPVMEQKIHEGRKRIDITFTNIATRGFFHWLALHYPAPFLHVECKNYSVDPANPELDQLSGRFSPSRGVVGLLVCRRIENRSLLLARCRDTASDRRGFILPLDDQDLETLVRDLQGEGGDAFDLLNELFEKLVM